MSKSFLFKFHAISTDRTSIVLHALPYRLAIITVLTKKLLIAALNRDKLKHLGVGHVFIGEND